MRIALAVVVLAGCSSSGQPTMGLAEDPCPDVETALALDEAGPGGFSAAEVLATWGATWQPTAQWEQASFDWTDSDALAVELAALEGTAIWYEPANADDPQCAGQDAFLRFDVEAALTASALADAGVTDGWMAARSLEIGEIEVDLHGTISPSAALETELTDWMDARYADWSCAAEESCEDWDGETWRLSAVSLVVSNANQRPYAGVGVEVETPDGSGNSYDALSGVWE